MVKGKRGLKRKRNAEYCVDPSVRRFVGLYSSIWLDIARCCSTQLDTA